MKKSFKLKDGVLTSLKITQGKCKITFGLGPAVKMPETREKHNISFKRYKHFVKGQIDNEKFKTDPMWNLPLAERLRSLKISQLLGIPHLNIMTGESNSFHDDYRLVVFPKLSNTADVIIHMQSIPASCPEAERTAYLRAFKERLKLRPITFVEYAHEDEDAYLPSVMFEVTARTIAEACKVVEIFLTEVENEVNGQLGLN